MLKKIMEALESSSMALHDPLIRTSSVNIHCAFVQAAGLDVRHRSLQQASNAVEEVQATVHMQPPQADMTLAALVAKINNNLSSELGPGGIALASLASVSKQGLAGNGLCEVGELTTALPLSPNPGGACIAMHRAAHEHSACQARFTDGFCGTISLVVVRHLQDCQAYFSLLPSVSFCTVKCSLDDSSPGSPAMITYQEASWGQISRS